jgi:hypothetical protein
MRVPQVKEAPAQALRAMFAGIGQLLSVSDKIRNKSAPAPASAGAETATPEKVARETAAPETAVPETVASEAVAPEPVAPEPVAPEPVAPEAVAPEAVAAEAVVPEPVAPEPVAAQTAAPEAEPEAAPAPAAAPAGELPLANYDDLSIASLRARLRNLSAEQLTQLIDYEKGHAARPDVITMFERRIAKLAEG